MPLHLIYGTAGAGKTRFCTNLLESDSCRHQKTYYIVPEQFSYTAERMVTEVLGAASPATAEVSSFKRLYYQVINLTGGKGLSKLTPGGKAILLNYICLQCREQFRILGKPAAYRGFAEILTTLLSEFKAYNATPDLLRAACERLNPADRLRLKLEDLCLIYAAYQQQIEDRFADADDELGILAKLICANPQLFDGSIFIFDGFSGFTPQETGVISALMGCAADIYFTFSCDSPELSGDHDIFAMQKRNMLRLRAAADAAGMNIAPDVKLTGADKYASRPDMEHLLHSIATHSYTKYEGTVQHLKISAHNSPYDEIEYVAEEITQLVRLQGLRYRDIQIIVRDSDRYFPVIRKLFDSFEIPVFLSKKMNAASQPAALAVVSALGIITENFSYEAVFGYLKSGFANLEYDELDLLENYIIATGIRGNSWVSDVDWHYTPYVARDFASDEAFLTAVNQIRRKFVLPVKTLRDALSQATCVREMCLVLYEFLVRIQLFDRIQGMIERYKNTDPQTASYYGQVWNILMSTLDEIADILGDAQTDASGFRELLITGLSSHEIGVIPTTADAVTVNSAENADGSRAVVFAVGVNDGVYPSVMTSEGLLNDRDRLALQSLGLELAKDTVSKAFDEDFIMYSVLGAAQRLLHLSYPVSDLGGGSRLPARLIRRCSELFVNLSIEDRIIRPDRYGAEKITRPKPTFTYFVDEMRKERDGEPVLPLWHEAGRWFMQNDPGRYSAFETAVGFTPRAVRVDEKLMDSLFSDGVLKVSVSRLELYKKCPFAHFASYLLRLQARQQAQLEVTDTGSLMHEVLEQLSLCITHKGLTWQDATDDFLLSEAERLVNEKIAEIEKQFDYPSNRRVWLLARLKNTLLSSVLFLAKHLKAGEFIPLGYEIEFDEQKKYTPLTIALGGKTLALRGKIDRADVYQTPEGERYIRVIDYKSGSRSFDISQMFYGLQLQLAVYLDRLCDLEDAKPAGILYFRLHDPVVPLDAKASGEEIDRALAKEYKMQGLVLADDAITLAMDAGVHGGSDVIPVKYTKDGSFDRFSSVASAAQFAGMRKKLHSLLRQLGREIGGGNADVLPVKYNGMTGCEYCDFADVCHFETGCGGRYNLLRGLPKQEIWNELEKEAGTDA